jgi:hypothetical protein
MLAKTAITGILISITCSALAAFFSSQHIFAHCLETFIVKHCSKIAILDIAHRLLPVSNAARQYRSIRI